MRADWHRVTAEHPCPVCGKPDYCRVGDRVVHCTRVQSDRPAKTVGWYHKLSGDSLSQAPAYQPPPPHRTDEELDRQFRRQVAKWRLSAVGKLPELSAALGVSVAALAALGVGWNGFLWTIPERSPVGLVTGVSTRTPEGAKKMLLGSRRGLVCPSNLPSRRSEPILIVEGMTDTAAGLTLGIATVGRPNNSTGGDLLVDLLWDWQGQIVVMGENDQREPKMPRDMKHADDCKGCQFCWPGKFGAETVAKVLREKLPKPQPRISIRYPANKAKDLRSWLNQTLRCPENPQACLRAGRVMLIKLGIRQK